VAELLGGACDRAHARPHGAEAVGNQERLELTPYEADRQRLAQILQAEARIRAKEAEAEAAKKQEGSFVRPADKTPPHRKTGKPPGRPKKADSTRAVEEETGIDRQTQIEIKRKAALEDRFVFLKRAGWILGGTSNTRRLSTRSPRVPAGAGTLFLETPGPGEDQTSSRLREARLTSLAYRTPRRKLSVDPAMRGKDSSRRELRDYHREVLDQRFGAAAKNGHVAQSCLRTPQALFRRGESEVGASPASAGAAHRDPRLLRSGLKASASVDTPMLEEFRQRIFAV
jgi:hypothetical protein